MWNLHPPSRGYLIEFIIIQLLSEMATKSFPSNEDHSLTHQASTAAQAYKLEWATQLQHISTSSHHSKLLTSVSCTRCRPGWRFRWNPTCR